MKRSLPLFVFLIFYTFFTTQAADYYWIGGSGNWSQISHWATTSGGSTVHSSVPGTGDNVIFDANSFTANGSTVTLDVAVNIKSMDWSGITYTVTMSGSQNPTIYGDLILSSDLTWSSGSYIYLKGIGTHDIDPNGITFTNKTLYLQDTGIYNLQDSLITTTYVYIQNRGFNTNGFKVSVSALYVSGVTFPQTVDLSTSKLYGSNSIYSVFSFANPNLSLDADSAHFYLTGSGGSFNSGAAHSFNVVEYTNLSGTHAAEINVTSNSSIDTILSRGVNNTCNIKNAIDINYLLAKNNVWFYGDDTIGKAEIWGDIYAISNSDCVFDTLFLVNNSNGQNYTLTYSASFTVNDTMYIEPGTCRHPIILERPGSTGAFNLIVKSKTVNLEYAYLNSITASGGATFNATNVIREDGNNSGWNISVQNGTDFYWVGDNGNWTDPVNWAYSSGGTPISTDGCYPRFRDDVFFDLNSFSAGSQIVDITTGEKCHDMTWTNTSYDPTIKLTYPGTLSVYGDFKLHDSMTWSSSNGGTRLYFSGDSIQNINYGGLTLDQYTIFNGTGTYELQDSIYNYNVVEVSGGTFNSNDHKIYCWGFGSLGSNSAAINLGQSTLNIRYYSSYSVAFRMDNVNVSLDLDSCTINILGFSSIVPQIRAAVTTDYHRIASQTGLFLNLKTGSEVDSLQVEGNLNVGQVNTISDLYCLGDVTISAQDTVKKASIFGDFMVNTTSTPVFDTLLFYDNNEKRTYTFRSSATFIIRDSVLFPSGNCTNTHEIKSSSTSAIPASRATISKPGGNFYANYVVVNSINGTGGASFVIDNLVSDDGNNAGLTTTPLAPFNLYWVGGAGYWDDPTNWSLTSGGTPQTSTGCLPSTDINAVFDSNSFSATGQKVYVQSGDMCRNLTWDGVKYYPTFKDTINYSYFKVYGSVYLTDSMNLGLFFGFELSGPDSFTVDFNSHKVPNLNIRCDGQYYLVDSLRVARILYHYKGSLISNDHLIRCGAYSVPQSFDYCALLLGNSTMICDSTNNSAGFCAFSSFKSTAYIDFDADSALIYLSGTNNSYAGFRCNSIDTFHKIMINATAYTFQMAVTGSVDSLIYKDTIGTSRISYATNYNYFEASGNVEISALNTSFKKAVLHKDLTLTQNLDVDTLYFNNNSGGRTYTINAGKTLHVRDSIQFSDGNCNDKHRIQSNSLGSPAYLQVDTGHVNVDYYAITSVYGRGNAIYNAVNIYETDARDSGWNVQMKSLDTLYWVGGSGNWSDPTQWSLSSGGTPLDSSDCLPNARTSVFFDTNSFSSTNQTVSMDIDAVCYTFSTAGANGAPFFNGTNDLTIYKNLVLTDSIQFNHTGDLFLSTNDSADIRFAGNTKFGTNSTLYINGSGSVNLLDSIINNGYMVISRGNVYTNNQKVHARKLTINGTEELNIYLGTSVLEVDLLSNSTASFIIDHTALNLNADQSTIRCMGASHNGMGCAVPDNDLVFNRIEFYGTQANITLDACVADSVLVYSTGPAYVYSSDTVNYLFANNDLQIRDDLQVEELMVYEDLSTIYSAKFNVQHATVYGNLSLGSSGYFDTLLLMNEGPGTLHKFNISDTCYVNDHFYINSNGCYKTTLQSTNTNSTGYISMPASATLDAGFLEIKSLAAIGGGGFNVGGNSSDLGGNSGWDFSGPTYTLRLKYQNVCIDTPGISVVKAVPDGTPTRFWWRQVVSPYDTFNTGLDTIMVSAPGDIVFVSMYGTNCTIEDSIFIRVSAPANGISQSFSNNAGDNSWFNCSNWSMGLIPDSISDATITAGDTVKILSGQNAYCHNLTNNGFIQLDGGNLYVHGSIIMNGSMIHNSGSLIISGNGTDSITSSSRAVFDSVTMDKNGYMLIKSVTVINKYLDLVEGYLQSNDADSFLFENNSGNSGGQDGSFVLGPVYKRGVNAFTYPIGDSSVLAQIGISAPSGGGSNTFKAQYYFTPYTDTSNFLSPLVRISRIEYWTLDRISGSGSVKVKLYFNDTSRSFIVDASYLAVARYDGSDWNSAGNSAYAQNAGAGYVESNYVSSFSPFTFGSTDVINPLPVQFMNVTVSWKDQDALVEWSTASELNNNFFQVERSIDGYNFEPVGLVQSKNSNSAERIDYSFLDPEAGMFQVTRIYYRIKQVDFDGQFDYSKTVILNKVIKLSILPNPTQGILTIKILDAPAEMTITDLKGKVYYNARLSEIESFVDISGLQSGIYFLKVDDGVEVITKKVVLMN